MNIYYCKFTIHRYSAHVIWFDSLSLSQRAALRWSTICDRRWKHAAHPGIMLWLCVVNVTDFPQTSPQQREDEEAREMAPRIKLFSNPELIASPYSNIETQEYAHKLPASRPKRRGIYLVFFFLFVLLHYCVIHFLYPTGKIVSDDRPFAFRRTSEHQAVFYGALCGQATVCRGPIKDNYRHHRSSDRSFLKAFTAQTFARCIGSDHV